jgi:hypothetical protein
MQEQVMDLVGGSVETGKSNRGRFQRGDNRINRVGRPRKCDSLEPGDRAATTDRLMRAILRCGDIVHRLTKQFGPWIINLDRDVEIVTCRFDLAQNAIVFILRSQMFAVVAKGSKIPDFVPEYYGLKWRRRTGTLDWYS